MPRVNENLPWWTYDYFTEQLPTGHVDASMTAWSLLDLVCLTPWAESKNQARQLVKSGAIKIKNEQITDVDHRVRLREFDYGKFLLLVKKNDICVIEADY